VVIQIGTTTQTVQAHTGDWVAYVGENAGLWAKGMCMRWNGGAWEQVSPTAEPALYMEALMDLTEGAPNGVFTSIFCRVIGAQQALIDTLMARVLTMAGDGVIQSEGFTGVDGNVKGYRLTARNGRIEANHGVFKDIDIFGTSTFAGNINSGMLQVSVNNAESHLYEYGPGTKEYTIRQTDRPGNILIGLYGDKAFSRFDIIREEEQWDTGSGTNTIIWSAARYSLYVVYTDNTMEKIAVSVYTSGNPVNLGQSQHYESHPTLTSKQIRYKYLGTGNSIKLLGVPDYVPTENGELCRSNYVSSDGLAALYIKVR
jgi:hypothetical protein